MGNSNSSVFITTTVVGHTLTKSVLGVTFGGMPYIMAMTCIYTTVFSIKDAIENLEEYRHIWNLERRNEYARQNPLHYEWSNIHGMHILRSGPRNDMIQW